MMAPQFQSYAQGTEGRGCLANLRLRPGIGRRYRSSAFCAEQRRSESGPRQSDHQNAFPPELDPRFHFYRSFRVVSANKAKTNAAIQKRTMILDSLQPASSK